MDAAATTVTITSSSSSSSSPTPRPKGALRRTSTSTSSPGGGQGGADGDGDGGATATKKCASFRPDLARDLQTGEIVSSTARITGAEYRAWFRERRQLEQRRRSVREQAERDFESALRKLAVVVAR